MTPLSRIRLPRGSGRTAAWLVFATGIVLSVAAWIFMQSAVERDARFKFRAATLNITAESKAHLLSYASLLYGLQGLYQADPAIRRAAFERYVHSLDLPLHFPGIRAISYAQRVPASAKAEFERQLRRDPELVRRGYGNVVIKPTGNRSEYVPIKYIEPLRANNAALGFDLAADEGRRTAIDQARDSGMPILSERVALAADPTRKQFGVVMRLALYRKDAFAVDVEGRREAFSGTANITFLVENLARHVLSGEGHGNFTLSIYDAGVVGSDSKPAPEELYSNAALRPPQAGAVFEDVLSIEVGQRRWQLKLSAPREYFLRPTDHMLPWAALSAVLAATLLLSGLINSLAGSRQRAQTLAAQITAELRESQARLTDEQRRTQELIEVLPNPIYFKDTDGRYLGVNRAWEKFFGVPRDAFIGKTVRELYPGNPEIAAQLHADDQALWDHPGTRSYETSVMTRDGRRHDAVYYKATFTHADGRVAGLIGNIVDISERKQAEAARAQLAAIVEDSGDAIISRSLDHKILTWNTTAQRLFGYTAEEAIGQPTSLLVPPEYEVQTEQQWASFDYRQPLPVYDAIRLAKGGRRVDVSVIQSPINDSNGNLVGLSISYRDISERKKAEKRQTMEHAVTRVMAEAETLADAISMIVQTICESLGWACGALWQRDEKAELLRRTDAWHIDTAEVADFYATTSLTTNEAPASHGEAPRSKTGGLVERVWLDSAPVWLPDVTQVPSFRRGPVAAKAGLHSAFGFPVMAGAKPLGVMEFYGRNIEQPDEDLLQVVQAMGRQIGQFIAHKQAEERISHLAKHDELTGLPNRSMFHEHLRHALALAQRQVRPLAILFIDLDRFKSINDSLGHDAGDRVLVEVAKRLRGCLRDSDVLARLGGDEFVVLIEGPAKLADLAAPAQKILDAMAKPFMLAAQERRIGASIGISTFPEDGTDALNLLKKADAAMYRAKEQGRNSYHLYSTQVNGTHGADHGPRQEEIR